MLRIRQAEDIDYSLLTEKKLTEAKNRHFINSKRIRQEKLFRVYIVNKSNYTAKGYWQDGGRLYKDRISFDYVNDYKTALRLAKRILKTTSEVCVSIEDLKHNKLYIVYRDKALILKIKYIRRTSDKKEAYTLIKKLVKDNGGATVEKKGQYYIITSYK